MVYRSITFVFRKGGKKSVHFFLRAHGTESRILQTTYGVEAVPEKALVVRILTCVISVLASGYKVRQSWNNLMPT